MPTYWAGSIIGARCDRVVRDNEQSALGPRRITQLSVPLFVFIQARKYPNCSPVAGTRGLAVRMELTLWLNTLAASIIRTWRQTMVELNGHGWPNHFTCVLGHCCIQSSGKWSLMDCARTNQPTDCNPSPSRGRNKARAIQLSAICSQITLNSLNKRIYIIYN